MFITNCDSTLLQSATAAFITMCDTMLLQHVRQVLLYYKVRQVLRSATSVITKYDVITMCDFAPFLLPFLLSFPSPPPFPFSLPLLAFLLHFYLHITDASPSRPCNIHPHMDLFFVQTECRRLARDLGEWIPFKCSERPIGQTMVHHGLRPCCHVISGQCSLTSPDHCEFISGVFHTHAEHCAEVRMNLSRAFINITPFKFKVLANTVYFRSIHI